MFPIIPQISADLHFSDLASYYSSDAVISFLLQHCNVRPDYTHHPQELRVNPSTDVPSHQKPSYSTESPHIVMTISIGMSHSKPVFEKKKLLADPRYADTGMDEKKGASMLGSKDWEKRIHGVVQPRLNLHSWEVSVGKVISSLLRGSKYTNNAPPPGDSTDAPVSFDTKKAPYSP